MRRFAAFLIVMSVTAAGTPPAAGQALTPDEQARFAAEAPVLGAAHAREHVVAERRARAAQAEECPRRVPGGQIDRETPPPEPGPTGQARCSELPDQPSRRRARTTGRWTEDVLDLPHYAIHAALLPTGKVLFWGFDWTPMLVTKASFEIAGRATLWDPAKGTGPEAMRAVPPPAADVNGDGHVDAIPLYCSGQSFLPDGRLLVTGGMLETNFADRGFRFPPGHRVTLVFDPFTETWERGPDQSVGRWYPTQVELADGRTAVLGGFDDARPNGLSSTLDVVSAGAARVRAVPSAAREVFLYPGLQLMPDGDVLLAGPYRRDSAVLDTKRMRWSERPDLPEFRGGGNLVPEPGRPGRLWLIGGAPANVWFDHKIRARAWSRTRVYDHARSRRGWRRAPGQRRARHYPNTVALPDGSMVTVGGSSGITPEEGHYTPSRGNRAVELLDPRAKRWRLGARQREDRTYHSVALLLPDGRVWSAGDDANPTRHGDTGEIYEPPYLFKGPRPRIAAAPKSVRHGRTLTVRARGARRLVLVAPGATTHGLDMHQRVVRTRTLARGGGRLRVRLPRRRAVTPPGRYMAFALSARGVPSLARWIRVR